jgi:deoxyribonuclease-4
MILGAHQSIAGGLSKAFDRAIADHAQSVQIFTKNVRGWKAKPLDEQETRIFRQKALETNIRVIAHSAYLVNLGSANEDIHKKSIAGFCDELERCVALGIPYLVLHPGSHPDLKIGIRQIAASLDQGLSGTPDSLSVVLESTAGQGTSIGHQFEHLASIIHHSRYPEKIGVCLDTCHLFAAGYDLAHRYNEVMENLNRQLGIERVKVFHLNDSKKGLGSRLDRHEEIGEGALGLDTFRQLLNDGRFENTVGVLETPRPEHYRKTLDLLRSLR